VATPAADWCNIGVGAGKNNYQLDYSTATGAGITTATPSTLASSTGISNIMYADASNTAMMLRSDVDVDPIATNGYPRSEFRERQQDGTTLRAFNPTTGDHWASTWVRPTHLPPIKPSFVMLQCHDAVQDLMEVAIQPRSDFATTGKLEVVLRIARTDHSGGSSSGIPRFVADFQWGTWLNPRIRMGAIAPGAVAGWSASCNGVVINSWDAGMPAVDTVNGSNAYFKSGMYLQTRWSGLTGGTPGVETDRNEYGEAAFRDLLTSHNGETATSVQVRGNRVEDIITGVTWGAKVTGRQSGGGTGLTSLTPALPTGLVDGDVMFCIGRASRGINTSTAPTAPGFQSIPSSPSIATSWAKIISTKCPAAESTTGAYAGGPQLAAHNVRWMLWVKPWVSGDTAPTVNYTSGSNQDTLTCQIFKCSNAKWSSFIQEVIDQPPAGLNMANPADNNNTITGINFAASTSTTVVGPTAALPANAQGGALAIACVYHETNVTSGGVGVVTGGSDGLTWAEGGEGVTTTVSGTGSSAAEDEPAFGHDWAIVPAGAGQAIPAKQAAATISGDANVPNTGTAIPGKGWGVLFTIAAAQRHRPRERRAGSG
jgi:hypothetical protein